MSKQVSPKIVALAFGILVISFAVAFYVVAWTEPTSTPPGGNVATPLNISSAGQIKTGNLVVNALGTSATSGNAIVVNSGESRFPSVTIVGGASLLVSDCDSTKRGKMYLLQSPAGTEDGLYICKKKTDNTYGWIALASPAATVACAKLTIETNKIYVPITFPDPYFKRFFVSSGAWNGNLGGLTGADAKCQAEGGNGVTWKALLGDTATIGISRINDGVFVNPTPVISEGVACYEVYAKNIDKLIDNFPIKFSVPPRVWAQSLKTLTSAYCSMGTAGACPNSGCEGAVGTCVNGYQSLYFNACKNWTYGTDDSTIGCSYDVYGDPYNCGEDFGCVIPNPSTPTKSYSMGQMALARDELVWTSWYHSLGGREVCGWAVSPTGAFNCADSGRLFCAEQ
ncbi:MAG: hypothetical protein ABIG29_00670 [Candidatus Nealsonbacteria bacterium]